jgi:hypothetical protein
MKTLQELCVSLIATKLKRHQYFELLTCIKSLHVPHLFTDVILNKTLQLQEEKIIKFLSTIDNQLPRSLIDAL